MIRVLMIGLILISVVHSQEVYRAIFDCAVGDLDWVSKRLSLIRKTADALMRDGRDYDFVLTIHSHCIGVVEGNLKKLPPKKAKKIEFIQSQLQTLKEHYNVKVKACEIALKRGKIKKMPKFIEKVPNSWITLIEFQNRGYAFVPF